jgi:hypothetical protein
MRPVNKGAGATYVPPVNISWNKYNNKQAITAAWAAMSALSLNTNNPLVLSIANCLQIVLDNLIAPMPPAAAAAGKKAVMDKVADVYKMGAGPLALALGPFCAYCETSIPGLIEVDHIANKNYFPTYTTTWANFLPSCGPCNNTKSNTPSRAALGASPPLPAIATTNSSDLPFYTKLRTEYAWPDYYNSTYQDFWLDFQFSPDNAMWTSLDVADAASLQHNYLISQNIATRTVQADVIHQGAMQLNQYVRVFVQEPNAAPNLATLCGLNNMGNDTYDRRLFNRTVAWFSILDIMRPLMAIQDEATFLQLWPVIQMASKAFGFWSLWVTLLSQYNDFDQPAHSLGLWLYTDPDAATYYPGTVTAGIELPPRG